MPLDESETVVNNDSQTTSPDSGAEVTPAEADSVTAPNSGSEGASADAGGAQPSQTDDGTRSLKTDEAQSSNGVPDPAVLEKRVKDSQRAFQLERQARLEHERKVQAYEQRLRQFQEQFGGIDPNELKQFRERNSVPMWSKRHPEHEKFQGYLQEAKFIESKLKGVRDPAKRQELEEFLWSSFPQEGAQALEMYREHLRQKQLEMLADPDSFFEDHFKKHFEPSINQWQGQVSQSYEQAVEAERNVKGWFEKADPAIWKDRQDYIKERLNKGAKWEQVQLELERDFYRTQASSADTAKRSAEEKERLLRGNAAGTVVPDPKTTKTVDPQKVAKERGIDPLVDGQAYVDLLFELRKNNQI